MPQQSARACAIATRDVVQALAGLLDEKEHTGPGSRSGSSRAERSVPTRERKREGEREGGRENKTERERERE